jgi:hypothetical protein
MAEINFIYKFSDGVIDSGVNLRGENTFLCTVLKYERKKMLCPRAMEVNVASTPVTLL